MSAARRTKKQISLARTELPPGEVDAPRSKALYAILSAAQDLYSVGLMSDATMVQMAAGCGEEELLTGSGGKGR